MPIREIRGTISSVVRFGVLGKQTLPSLALSPDNEHERFGKIMNPVILCNISILLGAFGMFQGVLWGTAGGGAGLQGAVLFAGGTIGWSVLKRKG